MALKGLPGRSAGRHPGQHIHPPGRLTQEGALTPARRVVRPIRIGGVLFDLLVTLVFIAVVMLQQLIAVV